MNDSLMSGSRGWFVLALVIVATWLLIKLAPVITPFAVAAGIAYLTDPMVDRLERIKIRSWQFSRTFAVTLVFLLLSILFAIALLVLIPLLIRQFRELVQQVPQMIDWFTATALPWASTQLAIPLDDFSANEMVPLLKDYWETVASTALNVVQTLGKGGKVAMVLLTNLVLIPVVAFYLMRDWDKLVAGVQRQLPRSSVDSVVALAKEIDEVLSAFIRGQLMVMLALGGIYAAGLWMIGLQAGFLIGLVAGLLSVVPYLGSVVGLALAVGMALFQFGDVLHVVLVLLVFAVGQSMEGMVLTPNLVGDKIGLHPVAVIFAVLAGGQLFGFLGILLALPAAAALNVLVRHAKDIYHHSAWYRDEAG